MASSESPGDNLFSTDSFVESSKTAGFGESPVNEQLKTVDISTGQPMPMQISAAEESENFGEQPLRPVLDTYTRFYASGEGHTARAKRYDLEYFLLFLAGTRERVDRVMVKEWTLQSTKDFIDHRLKLGEAPSTVARRLATIKHLGRTLAERVGGFVNPAREAKGPVVPVSRPQGLSAEEMHLLREAAAIEVRERPGAFLPLRNQFLIELLLATGLRADEVRLLNLSQISHDKQWLRNVRTKGKKYRNVYLNTDFRPVLENYLEARKRELLSKFPAYKDLPPNDKQRFPVLISAHSAKLDSPDSFGVAPKTIWRIVSSCGLVAQRIAEQTIGSLHPHRLRHTFAHGLLDSSKDVRLVAQALGHSDVRTTMRYTERSDVQVAAAIEAKIREA